MLRRIEGTHDGRRIVLPILILPPEPTINLTSIPARALLDTGATTSGIAERIATGLALRPIGKRPLGSARGEMQVERYIFRIGFEAADETPAFPFVFDEVIGFELANSPTFDALIGMDILSQCDFQMSRDRSWRLSFG